MANAWLDHVKKFWAKNKGKMSYSQALKEAKKSYHPTAKKGKQTKKDKKDESKGMKGKTKGSKSKSRKGDFISFDNAEPIVDLPLPIYPIKNISII